MWTVQCKVGGGVTGTHYGELKRDRAVRYFETRDEAVVVAREAQAGADARKATRGIRAGADFRYWVNESPSGARRQ